MLVDHKYRFLFVHIPKTGGAAFREYHKHRLSSWWRKDSEEVGAAHDPLTPDLAARFQDYFKFTIVRDPWRMIASAYRFDTQGVRRDKSGVLKQRVIPILDWLDEKVADPRFGPFPNQFRYISDGGRLLVDHVCRQDRLTDDIKLALGRFNAPYRATDWEKPTRHFYGSYDWKACFADPAVIAKVRDLCREDFEYFRWPWPFDQQP